jgi:hypothetical protein
MGGLQPGLQILRRRPHAPLRHRLRVDPRLPAPGFQLSVESEACDRGIGARTAYVVVAHS